MSDIKEFEEKIIKVDANQEPMRIDKYLMDRLEKVTRNKVQNAIKEGTITVNNKQVKPNFLLKPGHVIVVNMPKSPYSGEIIAQDIPLDIVYEDDDILVVNKQSNLVVHPGHGNYSGTLVNAIAFYLGKDLPVQPGNDPDRIGLVHRLDKDTTGLMVLAKTEIALSNLSAQFAERTIDRKYWALTWGEPDPHEGRIEGNIGRNPNNRMQMCVFPDEDAGKHAITHYKVLKPLYYVSLVECKLETGRTHQIRVHMKYIGNTLFNDERYGGHNILKGTVYTKYAQFVKNAFSLLPRQALHAKTLGFVHPTTGENMFFESELPMDFQQCLDKWEQYLSGRKEVLSNE